MKKLHEFTVKKKVIKKVEEKTEVGTLIKEVESTEDKVCFIKIPNRLDLDKARIVQSSEFGLAVSLGCQPRESLRKAILDGGGFAYAKVDIEQLEKILPALNEKRNEFQKLKIDGGETSIVEKELEELFQVVIDMEQRLTDVYKHSAETIAEQNTVIWAILNLTFWVDETPVFTGHTDESKKESYLRVFDDPETYSSELEVFNQAYIVLDAYMFKGYNKEQIEEILKDG